MLIKTDNLGIPRFTNQDLVDMIYSGHVDKCHVVLCDPSDDIEKFNAAMREQRLPELTKYIPLDVDEKTFDSALQSEWFMPDEYKKIDVDDFCMRKLMKIKNVTHPSAVISWPEWSRVQEELEEFAERDMYNLLRYMIYLVDFMRENDIVWGVGRGSSVASYVLFLIGVHKIDSLKYNLDWREFLRD